MPDLTVSVATGNPISVSVSGNGAATATVSSGGTATVTVAGTSSLVGAGKVIVSSGGLADLTTQQQAQITQGVVVVTTDGYRWVFSGVGSVTNQANYVQLADITPEWGVISGKPSTFAPSAHKTSHATGGADAIAPSDIGAAAASHTHAIADTTGLQTALDGKAAASHSHGLSNIQVGDGTLADSGIGSFLLYFRDSGNVDYAVFESGGISASSVNGLATVATSGSYDDLSDTPAAYSLPTASATVLGGIKVGSGLSIDGSSVLSATYSYTLPAATGSTLGGVIVGTGLGVSSGTVSVSYGATSGTACEGNDARLSDARSPIAHTHAASDITSGTIAAARLGSGTPSASNYLRGDGAWSTVTASAAAVYEFTRSSKPADATGSNGSYSWSLPSGAKLVEIFAIGGGGGGGSGRRGAAGTARWGGGGGSGANATLVTIPASLITTGLDITVGAAGAGGAAVTADDTNGNNGTNGGLTTVTFNGLLSPIRGVQGQAGSGGTATAGGGGAVNNTDQRTFSASAGGASSVTGNGSGSFPATGNAGMSGAGGGGISTGNVAYNGGTVWNPASFAGMVGAAGTTVAGGAASTTAAGGAGANGATYGYGGSGGGASANGNNSGAGGNGGEGYVRITVWS